MYTVDVYSNAMRIGSTVQVKREKKTRLQTYTYIYIYIYM